MKKVHDDELLAFIRRYRSDNGYAPSVRETASAFGVTGSTVQYRMRKLEAAGQIERTRGVARSTRVVKA